MKLAADQVGLSADIIKSAALDGRVPEDCRLVVDVIAEAVQANDYGLQAWNN